MWNSNLNTRSQTSAETRSVPTEGDSCWTRTNQDLLTSKRYSGEVGAGGQQKMTFLCSSGSCEVLFVLLHVKRGRFSFCQPQRETSTKGSVVSANNFFLSVEDFCVSMGNYE